MKKITNFTATSLIEDLQADNELGVAFNQSGIPLQTMTFREFLTWYADATSCHLSIENGTNETDVEVYSVVERVSGKNVGSVEFHSEEEAYNEFYERLERRYNDDNGAGGIFYPNADAIIRLEDECDEWHELFEVENEE